ncbi:hypothetical protein DESC_480002 [Desulfosarcina cetonica]|nr:hypothetical protein DESC_480002 [Desulfosarcina cetonica]
MTLDRRHLGEPKHSIVKTMVHHFLQMKAGFQVGVKELVYLKQIHMHVLALTILDYQDLA